MAAGERKSIYLTDENLKLYEDAEKSAEMEGKTAIEYLLKLFSMHKTDIAEIDEETVMVKTKYDYELSKYSETPKVNKNEKEKNIVFKAKLVYEAQSKINIYDTLDIEDVKDIKVCVYKGAKKYLVVVDVRFKGTFIQCFVSDNINESLCDRIFDEYVEFNKAGRLTTLQMKKFKDYVGDNLNIVCIKEKQKPAYNVTEIEL